MDNIAFTTSVMATTHEHRPTTIKRFYNDKYTAIIYCADCHVRLDSYIEQLSDENECPISVTDNTQIS